MSGIERCDEIIRLIDDVLHSYELSAVAQPGSRGHGPVVVPAASSKTASRL